MIDAAARFGVMAGPMELGSLALGLLAGLSVLTPSVAGGGAAALRVRRMEASGVLRPSAALHGATATRRLSLMNGCLVVQVAASLVLVCGTLLFGASLRNKMEVDPGFTAEGVVRVGIRTPFDSAEEEGAFRRAVTSEVAMLAGVHAASWAASVPFYGVTFVDDVERDNGDMVHVVTNFVDHNFFSVMDIPVLRGRALVRGDRPGAGIGVVSRRLANRLWPTADPIGRRFRLVHEGKVVEVVGVVGDTRYIRMDGDDGEVVYRLLNDEFSASNLLVGVEYTGAIGGVLEWVRSLDAGVVTYDTRTMSDIVDAVLWRDRMLAANIGAFGLLGLVLSVLGLAAGSARMVGLRRREIGIRLALGAGRRSVFLRVVGEGVTVLACGILGGAAAASGMWPVVRSQVFGVESTGFAEGVVGAVGVLVAAGVLAVAVPAGRALRVDPATVLVE